MKPTVRELRRTKGARLAMLTAYDYPGARLVAEARGISYEELEALVEANAARLFGW